MDAIGGQAGLYLGQAPNWNPIANIQRLSSM
jgi:hypothetical protein